MGEADRDGGAAERPHRRGPRPTDTAWRERILDAARNEFGSHGYQGTTVRRVGQSAGVDPKLVHYYFGTKEQLFSATVATTFHARGLPDLLLQPADASNPSPGTNYLLAVLATLEDDGIGPGFIGLVRNIGTHEESRRLFLRFATEEFLQRIAPTLRDGNAEQRASLAGTQLLGLVFGRYILKLPPLAELSIEEVARAIGPTIDRYLFGEVSF